VYKMDRFFNEYLSRAFDFSAHPYCIAYGTPITFYVPRTIEVDSAKRVFGLFGYVIVSVESGNTATFPNPTKILCFGQLYNAYRTTALVCENFAEIGMAMAALGKSDFKRLGRCVGYDGDIMPQIAKPTANFVDPKIILPGQYTTYQPTRYPAGNVWTALYTYLLYVSGKVTYSLSYPLPIEVTSRHRNDLQKLIAAKWISWEGQALSSDHNRNGHPPGLMRHQNLMFAVPTYAIAELVRQLVASPYAFAVASDWPLHYGLEEWRLREKYITGRTSNLSHFTSPTQIAIAASWNYLFGENGAPDLEFRSMYVTVCVHALEDSPALISEIAAVAELIQQRDGRWHEENRIEYVASA